MIPFDTYLLQGHEQATRATTRRLWKICKHCPPLCRTKAQHSSASIHVIFLWSMSCSLLASIECLVPQQRFNLPSSIVQLIAICFCITVLLSAPQLVQSQDSLRKTLFASWYCDISSQSTSLVAPIRLHGAQCGERAVVILYCSTNILFLRGISTLVRSELCQDSSLPLLYSIPRDTHTV